MPLSILRAAIAALVLSAGMTLAAAQTLQTGFADFGSDEATPIEIEADTLEVQDRQNVAVFTGNVTVTQADAALQTARLTVHYAQDAAAAGDDAPATPQNQRIARLEADGKVVITAEGQSATGDSGTVDFDGRTLSLNGNVTLTQEGNVVTGDTLTVDLNTGVARVESRSRVRVLLNPGSRESAPAD
jgi:lipopolysaccharide export system protein LptA